MKLPKIDISAVPGLENGQGLFGSLQQSSAPYQDGVVDIMVYVYDVLPPEAVV
ncbi:MAG: hypothetical protein QNI87_00755 [Erythrobacter sp.]|uniref:hypothetical protein n=1 Tax=Erythrobacter sp. TaxID=1042 RepID=UPI00260FB885|nr:hypothetical protein [Erythrobacter sp.]MDJ0977046.1 hypothetical protein [Erythrobacter sp.]